MEKIKMLKNRKLRLIILIESSLIILCLLTFFRVNGSVLDKEKSITLLNSGKVTENGFYIDEDYNFSGTFLEISNFSLKPGVYSLKINYQTDDKSGNSFSIDNQGTGLFYEVLSNPVTLYGGRNQAECQFYVLNETDNLKIKVNYSGKYNLAVKDVDIIRTNNGSKILLSMLIVIIFLTNKYLIIFKQIKNNETTQEKLYIYFGIPTLAIIASIPIFVDYILSGADTPFHLTRIEALANEIVNWNFPIRIESMWLFGHGYANSIFYCDTFLFIPAILRLIGFPMVFSYNIYIFIVNFFTAKITYHCTRNIVKSNSIGLIGAVLYTLAPYRIVNIYNRGAVGEYTAMIFFPVIIYGFYKIFTEDIKKKEYKTNWIILVIGYSGVIQSHVLSFEIVTFFSVLLCAILIKKVIKKQVLINLLKFTFFTIIINLWFLIPLLDMMLSDQYKFSLNSNRSIQSAGVYLAHVFYTLQAAGNNSLYQGVGMIKTEPIGVGIAIIFGVVLFFVVYQRQGNNYDKVISFGKIAFIIGLIGLIMSLTIFPWDQLKLINKFVGQLVTMVQFATRYTMIPTICFSFVSCIGFYMLGKEENRTVFNMFYILIIGLAIMFSMYQTNDILLEDRGIIKLYSAQSLGHSAVLGAEYLPIEADLSEFVYHDAIPSKGVELLKYSKNNLMVQLEVSVEKNAEEYYIDLPILHYKGYTARDVTKKTTFEITQGNNADLRVILPPAYEGEIEIKYDGMWYWRIADIISIFGGVTLVFIMLKFKKKLLQ